MLITAMVGAVHADVRLPSLISDHMVLQADAEIRIWGWASPGEVVTVRLGDQSEQAVADANQRWMVKLQPMQAGGPFILEVEGNNKLVVEDVLIGEVWLCSGQSNMEMPVRDAFNASEEIARSADPQLRFFEVKNVASAEPQQDVPGRWVIATPQTVSEFSAAGYFFGRNLREKLNKPVGLIDASWGGTLIEAWMAIRSLRTDPEFEPILDRLERSEELLPDFMDKHREQLEAWEAAVERAEIEGRDLPPEPWVPRNFRLKRFGSYLFNGMINPMLNYRIQGVLWYQGESNAVRGEQYRKLLSVMIDDWRKRWEQPRLPFIVVQVANYMSRRISPNSPSAWAELRESQMLVAKRMPDVGLVVTIDIGEAKNIHARNKQDVGYRASLWALNEIYGQSDLVHSGPIYRSFRRSGRRIIVSFRHTGSGLLARDDDKLVGFSIAGDDQIFYWAHAEIDGDRVVVWSDEVTDPVAVRYGWANNPAANLYNAEGLPASPFRTDNWDGVTTGKK